MQQLAKAWRAEGWRTAGGEEEGGGSIGGGCDERALGHRGSLHANVQALLEGDVRSGGGNAIENRAVELKPADGLFGEGGHVAFEKGPASPVV